MSKEQRLQQANELLVLIASKGREFFRHEGRVAHFELRNGRVWYVDAYTQRAIYTHSTYSRWRGFTGGGTLLAVIRGLSKWIHTGQAVEDNHYGPWPDWYCGGDVWEYGSDMEIIRAKAREIGVIKNKE